MKVNLIKEAIYELDDAKTSSIPLKTFLKLSSINEDEEQKPNEKLRNVRIFASIEEFRENYTPGVYDENEMVKILSNGQFCLFLKDDIEPTGTTKTGANKNVTTNTKEDTTKKS